MPRRSPATIDWCTPRALRRFPWFPSVYTVVRALCAVAAIAVPSERGHCATSVGPTATSLQVGDAPEVSVVVQESAAEATPTAPERGLMVAVIDRSGSMEGERWKATLADLLAVRLPAAKAAAAAGGFDVRLYPFSDSVAEYANPAKQTFTVGNASELGELESFIRDGSKRGLGSPYGRTALYGSVRAVAEGLLRERALDRYGWVYLVIYSDGDDSETPGDALGMCEALESLTRDPRISVERVKVVQVKDLGCSGVKERAIAGSAVASIPRSYSMSVAPAVVVTQKAGDGARLPIRLKWTLPTSLAAPKVSFRATGLPAGATLESGGGGVSGGQSLIEVRCDRALVEGARFRVDVEVALDGGSSLKGAFDAVVPALEPMPPFTQWGLPEGCTGPDGFRYVICQRSAGSVLPSALTVAVPEVQVRWWVDGDGPRPGSSLAVAGWKPGTYGVDVQIETSDGRQSAREKFRVCVLDASVAIRVRSTLASGQVKAGDPIRLEIDPPAGLPRFLLGALDSAGDCWFSGGSMVPSAKGLSCEAPAVVDAGTSSAEFQWSYDCGPQRLVLRGRTEFAVLPGASIRVLTDRVTRGKNAVVEIAVQQPDQVHEIRVRLPESGAQFIAERPASDKDPWSVIIPAGDAARAAKALGDLEVLTIEATPILKEGSTGRPTEFQHPGNLSRRASRTIALSAPDVALQLCSGDGVTALVPGGRQTFGGECRVSVLLTGIDCADVGSVTLTCGTSEWTGAPARSNCALDAAGRPLPITFEVALPSEGDSSDGTLVLVAEAFGKDGKAIGTAMSVTQTLRPGRMVWAWALLGIAWAGVSFLVVRVTFGNTRLGQEYRWSRDREGHDALSGGAVGVLGEVRLNLWSKTMTVDVPVDALPGPEGEHAWLYDLRGRLGGAIRFTIDRFDNTEGDGYRLSVDRFEPGPDAAGFVLRAPPAGPGKRIVQHPLVLNFFHQNGAATRFAVAVAGFLFVVSLLGLLLWLYWQDWF